MRQFSINQLTTMRWTFEEDVHLFAERGFRSLGLDLFKTLDFGSLKARELLEDAKMTVSSIGTFRFQNDIAGPTLEEQIFDAQQAVLVASELSANCLIVHTGGIAGHLNKHKFRLIDVALEALLPFAERNGVRLAMEPLATDCSQCKSFSHNLDDLIELIQRYDSKYLGLNLDLFYAGVGSLERDLDIPASQLFLIQLCDSFSLRRPSRIRGDKPSVIRDRCPLGEGSFSLKAWQNFLRNTGYRGFIEFEWFGNRFESQPYSQTVDQIHDACHVLSGTKAAEFDSLKV